jgi:hypothetical protein
VGVAASEEARDRRTVGRHERFRRPTPSIVVEHTFSWFGRNAALPKDFEKVVETLATFVTLAPSSLPSGGSPGPKP